MNPFVRHHLPSIAFSYRCFDRLLCNAFVPRLLFRGSLHAFLRNRRHAGKVTPAYLRGISTDYHS